MQAHTEELKTEKQKKIISEIIAELSKENMDLYYTDSSTIANLVIEKIQNKEISTEKFDLVKDLKTHDVLILMSYNSNCC